MLGVSGLGVSALVGASRGIFKITDYGRSPDGRWNKDLVLGKAIAFEEHICPTATPAPSVIEAGEHVAGIAPEVAEEVANARRVRLAPRDVWRMVTPEVVRDAFSYNEEAECIVITVKPVGHAWGVYSKTALKVKCVRTRQRHAAKKQLTQELERQDNIITSAKPEESIWIDQMQDDNGDKKG